MSEATDYTGASYVLSSKYRQLVMESLTSGPAMPNTIADEYPDVRMTHVSRALKELRGEGYVELLVNDEKKKGRIYGLTDDGLAAAETAQEVLDR